MQELIISSSVLIIVVVAICHFFKGKISLRLQYALWALVLIRLLVPLNLISSPLSVMNAFENASSTVVNSATKGLEKPKPDSSKASETSKNNSNDATGTITQAKGQASQSDWIQIAEIIWCCGSITVFAILLFCNISFARKLKKTRKIISVENCDLPVYLVDTLPSPCIYGIFRTAIYITPITFKDETKLHHVLEHELTHYRHGDHIWSVLRGLCLTLYWFNPLVWLAAVLSKQDAELACDEDTIKRIGEESRIEYGRTLIGLTTNNSSAMDLICCATTMTSYKKGVKERIMLISKKPKMVISTLVAVILISALTVGCTFTGATTKGNTQQSDKSPVQSTLPSASSVNPSSSPNTETVDINKISVSDLSVDTTVGVGVFLDYASDKIVVFHGYFGLFAYDLKEQKIILSIDLKKSVGTTNIQGSETADVKVSADGSLIQLFSFSESGTSKNAYYINTSNFSCTYEAYRELESCYSTDESGFAQFSDGTHGEIVLGGDKIGKLSYKRGDMVYNLFK